jgi:Ankyrin repeat
MDKSLLISPTVGERHMTALMNYAWGCYPGGMRRELQAGVDPNAQDQNGYTALMWLCRMYDKHFRERKRMFRSLLRYGASVDAVDTVGQDVLAHASDGPERRFRRFVRAEVRRVRRARA